LLRLPPVQPPLRTPVGRRTFRTAVFGSHVLHGIVCRGIGSVRPCRPLPIIHGFDGRAAVFRRGFVGECDRPRSGHADQHRKSRERSRESSYPTTMPVRENGKQVPHPFHGKSIPHRRCDGLPMRLHASKH